MKYRKSIYCLLLFFLYTLLLSACQKEKPPVRDDTAVVLSPEAPGTQIFQAENVILDISNITEGYFMVQYSGTAPKVRVQITAPDGTKRQPILAANENVYQAFPISNGDGTYQITILENITGNTYAVLLSQSVEVTLTDEFRPFLYPNQYVDFHSNTAAVSKGAELAGDTYSDLEVIQNIYYYVIQNISYDEVKATQVKDGYIPVIDETLSSGKGICFDYASLMTCMMRTQRIPTKLEIGYSGDTKHAWISAYVKEIGWIDNIIEFDGSSWTLMDPTLAANNKRKDVKKYVGNGNNYTVQYSY